MRTRALTGTEMKVSINLDAKGVSMKDYDFVCDFFVSVSRVVRVSKDDMTEERDGSYTAIVDTNGMASGEIKMRVTAYVPDARCKDGLRTEVRLVPTGIVIRRNLKV